MSSADPPSTLCLECLGITFDDVTGDASGAPTSSTPFARTDTYPDLPILRNSVKTGCTFCQYLCFLVTEKLPPRFVDAFKASTAKEFTVKLGSPAYVRRSGVLEFITEAVPVSYDDNNGLYYLDIIFESKAWPGKWRAKGIVYQHEGSEAILESLNISLRLPALNALDLSSINPIKSWLQTCSSTHPDCQPTSHRTLPTRLIDLGNTSTSTPILISTASHALPPSTPYIALSYCWGTLPQPTTTSSTLPSYMASPSSGGGIPTHTMPATHRDLILLARHLAIRYLWIDALCIIQDDPLDWEVEAASMFSVYRNGYLTVVAAAGDSCHTGFLSRSKHGPCVVVPFRSRMEEEHGAGVAEGSYLLSGLTEHRTWDAHKPAHMHGSAWEGRAWTLQEDIMSTRVVYFSDRMGYVRCQMERRGESSAIVYGNVLEWSQMLSPAVVVGTAAGGDVAAAERRDGLYTLWRGLVAEFSRRKLTVSSDKLPALSGLARSFGAALGDEYVAGLWRGDLVRGLLWVLFHDSGAPASWRAPSWSWAAWQGLVGWGLDRTPIVSQCLVREVCVVPAGTDPFARVQEGHIVLSAAVRNVMLRPASGHDVEEMDSFAAEVLICGDGGDVVAGLGALDAVTSSGWGNDGTRKPIDLAQLSGLTGVAAVVLAYACVSVGEDEETGEWKSSQPVFPTGLLVTKVRAQEGEGLAVYKRLGVFITDTLSQAGWWTGLPHVELKLV